MNVLVLCGGAGIRATHLPPGVPKFLTPVGDTTVGDLLLGYLGRQGATSVVLACAHGREAILAHVWKQKRARGATDRAAGIYRQEYPFHLNFDLRHEARGTIQAIRWALGARLAPGTDLSPPLVVVNGDTLLDIDLAGKALEHDKNPGMTEIRIHAGSICARILGTNALTELRASHFVNIEDHGWTCGAYTRFVPADSFLDVGTPTGAAAAEGWVREHYG